MSKRNYTNFVRASSPEHSNEVLTNSGIIKISGEEAQRVYLEAVKDARNPSIQIKSSPPHKRKHPVKSPKKEVKNKDLFLTVENNDVEALKLLLDSCPDKINIIDDYGWSLLMIACQANSIDAVKELLERGIDMSIRDKAGNSARSLVIKNKNYVLADILLNHRHKSPVIKKQNEMKVKRNEFFCELCSKTFEDKEEHLASTIHNINASRGKKIPTNYAIPQTNRGFQIMLKVGWDKESGLGRDGTGKKYPIKVLKKDDRKGLGHKKRKHEQMVEDNVKHKNRKNLVKEFHNNRRFEINFRREFY